MAPQRKRRGVARPVYLTVNRTCFGDDTAKGRTGMRTVQSRIDAAYAHRDWYMARSPVDRTAHSPPRSQGSCLVALIKGRGRTLPQSCDAAFLHRISRRFDLEAIYRWKHTRDAE